MSSLEQRLRNRKMADYEASKDVYKRAQTDVRRSIDADALRADRAALIRGGAMAGSLPEIRPGMSDRDLLEAQKRIQDAGARSQSPAATAPTQATTNDPFAPLQDQINRNFTAPVADKLAKAQDARDLESKMRKMDGQQIQTPYGTASSRNVTWQEKLVQQYPELGKAGTAHNADFVKAFKAAGSDPSKAADIAANIYSKRQQDPTAMGGALYKGAPSAEIAAPKMPGEAVAPVMFAGMDAGAAKWDTTLPKNTYEKAVQNTPIVKNASSFADYERFADATRKQAAQEEDAVKNAPAPMSTDVNIPEFAWKKPLPPKDPLDPSGTKLALAPTMPTSTPLGTSSMTEDVPDAFAQNPDEAQMKKRLTNNRFNTGK